jgi:hypothetical protein
MAPRWIAVKTPKSMFGLDLRQAADGLGVAHTKPTRQPCIE